MEQSSIINQLTHAIRYSHTADVRPCPQADQADGIGNHRQGDICVPLVPVGSQCGA
jgi:hypothetical protein